MRVYFYNQLAGNGNVNEVEVSHGTTLGQFLDYRVANRSAVIVSVTRAGQLYSTSEGTLTDEFVLQAGDRVSCNAKKTEGARS